LPYPYKIKSAEEEEGMQLTDFARKVPDEVWTLFEPILPPVGWGGNGCPPYDNRACLHAVLYVLVTGIGWRMLPAGFPSDKTVQRRLKVWLAQEAFRQAWGQLAQRYDTRQGVNGDEVLVDGSKKPAKKGVRKRGPAPWIAANAGRRSTSPVMHAPCR
jgi:transposase